MSKREIFINWVIEVKRKYSEPIPPEVDEYLNILMDIDDNGIKPEFTENGKAILKYLQNAPVTAYKSKDIAEGMFVASKSVSGAMRKLVTDGYVEKIGKDPVVYMITEKGKNIVFEGENE